MNLKKLIKRINDNAELLRQKDNSSERIEALPEQQRNDILELQQIINRSSNPNDILAKLNPSIRLKISPPTSGEENNLVNMVDKNDVMMTRTTFTLFPNKISDFHSEQTHPDNVDNPPSNNDKPSGCWCG